MNKPFNETSPAEWKALIEKELKGAKYEDLLWKAVENVVGKPDYTKDDRAEPVVFTPLRNNSEPWLIREDISIKTHGQANKEALILLNQGVNSLGIVGAINRDDDLAVLLKDIELPYVAVNFDLVNGYGSFMSQFIQEIRSQQYPAEKIRGGLAFDPVGELIVRGNWIKNEIRDKEDFNQLIKECENSQLTNFQPILVDASTYHNAGADPVTELAASLSHGNAYLNWARESGLNMNKVARQIHFKLACGRKYFSQISKIRAFRPLWANVCAAYEIDPQIAGKVFITGETSLRERSIRDAHINLLRSTTQCMSAIIGGCDAIRVAPFDENVREENPFSLRMARNLQLILFEEGGLGVVNDPAGGSYLFDQLSKQFMEEAWKQFKEIESQGGLIEAVKTGWLQDLITGQAMAEEKRIARGETVYIGVNKYPNPNEMPLEETTKEKNDLESKQVEPLPVRRAPAPAEETQASQP